MNAKKFIYAGTLIGVIGFVVNLLDYPVIARFIFIAGFTLAFFGIVATAFFQNEKKKSQNKKALFYRFSIVGFTIATLAVILGGPYGEYVWPVVLFRIGALIFVISAVISMFFSRKN